MGQKFWWWVLHFFDGFNLCNVLEGIASLTRSQARVLVRNDSSLRLTNNEYTNNAFPIQPFNNSTRTQLADNVSP